MMVYLGADVPLRLVPWDEAAPGFNVAEVDPERPSELAARNVFSKRYMVVAGSSSMCGCGFNYWTDFSAMEDMEDPDDEERAKVLKYQENRRQLVDYLREVLRETPEVEVFTCWDGEEADGAEDAGVRRVEEMLKKEAIEKGQLVRVVLEERDAG